MSAISPIENVVVAEVAVKAPKVKKPALPAKLQKFASNIYFILKTLNEQGLLSDENFERSIVENHLFDPIDNLEQQTVVLQAILDQQPAALKTFRKTATARNKPPKAPKAAKAPKEPKEKKEKVPKEPKAPKAKKEKKAVVEEPTEVSPPPAAEVVVTVTEPDTKPKKVKKAKKAEPVVEPVVVEPVVVEQVVVETAPAPAAPATKEKKEKKAKEPKEKKEKKEPKEKATKKTKNVPKVTSDADEDLIGQIVAAARSSSSEKEPEQEQEDEDEDDLIQTREFSHEGTLYLIDQDNLLYSSSSHEHIGSFDPASNSIVLL